MSRPSDNAGLAPRSLGVATGKPSKHMVTQEHLERLKAILALPERRQAPYVTSSELHEAVPEGAKSRRQACDRLCLVKRIIQNKTRFVPLTQPTPEPGLWDGNTLSPQTAAALKDLTK